MEVPQTQPPPSTSAHPEPSGAPTRLHPRRGRGGKPQQGQRTDAQGTPSTDGAESSNLNASRADSNGAQRGQRPPRRGNNTQRPQRQQPGAASTTGEPNVNDPEAPSTATPKPPRIRSKRPRKPQPDNASETNSQQGSDKLSKPVPNRRSKFGGKLTQDDQTSEKPKEKLAPKKPSEKYKTTNPLGDDLASTLIRSLSTPPYPDCPICFSSIQPSQATWSCSPLIPVIPPQEGAQVQYCWTPFHIGCIKSWAAKSVKDVAEAWRTRGELDRKGDWRCPGCQAKRETVPSGYKCFCGSVPEPKLARLATPHSCGQPCSRVRESGCGHPCPLLCHPGPCPPCQVTSHFKCYCPRKTVLSFRCGVAKGKRDLSCGQVCERSLACGKHQCASVCHDGDCAPCSVVEVVKCYCGKHKKEMLCGEGKAVDCFVEGEAPWIGRYSCDETCQRPFDCGIHTCEKPCHPPSSTPAPCPRSPSIITHCPCGRTTVAPPDAPNASQYDHPTRPNCRAPIPTCKSQCSKPHPSCSHPCAEICHTGPCPPCQVAITRPCRCGSTTRKIPCHEAYSSTGDDSTNSTIVVERDFLCDRPCPALRACGRHQCHRICCPLASLAAATNKKGKKRAAAPSDAQAIGTERGGLHECDLVCGKPLSCGNHRCEEKDHKGPCPPCLRSSFEELFCACGRTVLEPPIPCGTKIQCSYPCPRPPPPCGHPRAIHACHDDSLPCPPCPFLTSKPCACGKKQVPNVRCSLENDKVSCGTVCGKLMPCGFHHCQSLCHSGDCGACTAPCGKSRKLCLPNQHPCTLPCHAPSACPETSPCDSVISITCPCGRLKQAVKCGKHSSNPDGHQHAPLKCTTECAIAKRNAKLAEALGISTQEKDKEKEHASYNEDVVAFARANSKFVPVVEKAFADFVNSEKRHQVLPHMTPEKRKFVHDLASVYRLDTQMIDQEPNRSVQLIRRIDTRIPNLVLSTYLSSLPTPNLGKLADLRTLKSGISPSPSPAPSAAGSLAWRTTAGTSLPRSASPSYVNVNPKPAPSAGTGRGWTSVVRPTPGGSSVPVLLGSVTSTPSVTPSPSANSGLRANGPPSRHQTPVSSLRTSGSEVQVAAAAPVLHAEPVTENWEDDL